MRKLTYWLAGLLLIAVAIGAVLLLNNIQEISWAAAENAVCEATVADSGGADINSAFRFTFEGDVGANAVRRFLTVEPAVEMGFHQGVQAREVLVVPAEPLQPETVYRFSLKTERETLSWAFQTKREWRVESAAPAQAALAVSTGAVLEIYFNQSLSVDLSAAPGYFSVEPAVKGRFEQVGNCLRFVPEAPLRANTVYTVSLLAGLPAAGSDLTLAEDYVFAFETANADGSAPSSLWQAEAQSPSFLPGRLPSFNCDFSPAAMPPPAEGTESGAGEPHITATLYKYAAAESFAADLLEERRRAPRWSFAGLYPHGASTAGLTQLSAQEFTPLRTAEGWRFSWPTSLPAGCYLLQAVCQGQSRDIRFQVSSLTAFVQAAVGESLVWAHDASQGLPAAGCAVSYVNGGGGALTDETGLARLNVERELQAVDIAAETAFRNDVFLLRLDEKELVVEDYGLPTPRESGVELWQYLLLDKEIYQSGDTLEFWGYMRRRDNLEWEWGRVSVYVCAYNAPDKPVAQGYTPLDGNLLRGSIELPCLIDGLYELQIWQSGQLLMSRPFMVGEAAPIYMRMAEQDSAINLSCDKAAYMLNESYTLSLEGAEPSSGYLFFKSGGGLKEAVVEQETRHQGEFGPDDYGGSYWQAVTFDGERYQLTPMLNLPAASSAYALHITAETEEIASRGETLLRFTVRNIADAVPDKAQLLVLIAPPGRRDGDILRDMYAPNRPSGLALWPEPAGRLDGWAALSAEQALFFDTLTLDKSGKAELSIKLPPGGWRLYAAAVADAPLPLAGSLSLTLSAGPRSLPEEKEESAGEYMYWATRYDMSADGSHMLREGLLFFSERERVQAMELLWQSLSGGETFEQTVAAVYARALWQSYGYEGFALPGPAKAFNLSAYQRADGAIAAEPGGAADLWLSLLAASLSEADLFDNAALARYLQTQNSAPFEQRAMATAGLAALGQPVLQELRLMLAQAGEAPLARACLLWGLACGGDVQAVKSAWLELRMTYATDATSGIFYLEGGQGENIHLNSMGSMLAAACGEAQSAFALLGYLQNQKEQPQNTSLTEVFIAAGLLPYVGGAEFSAALSLNNATVEITPGQDKWLLQPTPGNLLVERAEGDIALTCLRWLRR